MRGSDHHSPSVLFGPRSGTDLLDPAPQVWAPYGATAVGAATRWTEPVEPSTVTV
jgi:hypothetical protein